MKNVTANQDVMGYKLPYCWITRFRPLWPENFLQFIKLTTFNNKTKVLTFLLTFHHLTIRNFKWLKLGMSRLQTFMKNDEPKSRCCQLTKGFTSCNRLRIHISYSKRNCKIRTIKKDIMVKFYILYFLFLKALEKMCLQGTCFDSDVPCDRRSQLYRPTPDLPWDIIVYHARGHHELKQYGVR